MKAGLKLAVAAAGLLAASGFCLGETPRRYVQVEPYVYCAGLGMDIPCGRTQLGTVSFIAGRLRFGVGIYQGIFEGWSDDAEAHGLFPVHCSYYFIDRPRRTGLCYSFAPALLAEAGAAFNVSSGKQGRSGFTLRGSVAYSVEYYGLGVGVEGGLFDIVGSSFGYYTGAPHWYLGLQLRFLSGGFRLS